VYNDAAKTECKLVNDEKDVHKVETPVTRLSGPRSSVSAPRQSKTSGMTPRSTRSSAAHSVRGTYVKSKSGFSKYGHRPPQSPSSSLSKLPVNEPSAKKMVDSEPPTPKTSSKIDASIANSCRHIAAVDSASFSRLFTGSFKLILLFIL